MSENRLLRIMFGPRRDDTEHGIIKLLQTENLYNSFPLEIEF
jgi:hypothetical protein